MKKYGKKDNGKNLKNYLKDKLVVKPKSNAGRKWFDGKNESEVIAKLEQAWIMDYSDAQASLYADILPCTLSRYLEAHPEIKQRKELLLNSVKMSAKTSVAKTVREDGKVALDYLSRVEKEKYSARLEHTGENGGPITVNSVSYGDKKQKRSAND